MLNQYKNGDDEMSEEVIKKPKYSLGITIIKGIKTAIVYGIPLALAVIAEVDPAITSITVGTLLLMILNWAKHN